MITPYFDWITARDALKSTLEGVSGIYLVHGYPRIEDTQHIQRWKKMMVPPGTKYINAWTIGRTGMRNVFQTNKQVLVLHDVMINVFYEHNDERVTQDEFDVILDALLQRMFGRIKLDDTCELQGPAQLITENYQYVADTLVHYAEITTTVQQRVTAAPFS